MSRSESGSTVEKKDADKPKEESTSTSSAIGLVKAFISIIESASGDSNRKSNFKYISQIWALALRSLRIVHVHELGQEKIFDQLISAFIKSSTEVQQTTFPQLLEISEKIA